MIPDKLLFHNLCCVISETDYAIHQIHIHANEFINSGDKNLKNAPVVFKRIKPQLCKIFHLT